MISTLGPAVAILALWPGAALRSQDTQPASRSDALDEARELRKEAAELDGAGRLKDASVLIEKAAGLYVTAGRSKEAALTLVDLGRNRIAALDATAALRASVIASLWTVEDQSTADLMTAFYERLFALGLVGPADNRPASRRKLAAFTEARKQLRKANPHPFHWAPFIYLGDPR